ncbi:NADPH-dependent FMN reductase [Bdellovibrio sp. HCB337]|uniref:NADPH-dependent FMN reductase n=1 Tax=Bdellovibrio sp. HCB337 TaxID=3394358 RepID=UPI0039A4171D
MKILMFAASFRKDSLNKKLIRNAAQMIPSGHEVNLKEFNEYAMPLYHGDLETDSGIPDAAQKFIQDIADHDAIIISSPEYNSGIPGTLKNAIDWTSRVNPVPWVGKQVLIMGASPGMVGTNRGMWEVRKPLEYLGAHVYPEMMGFAQANKAFDEHDQLKEEAMRPKLQKLLFKFTEYAEYVSKFRPAETPPPAPTKPSPTPESKAPEAGYNQKNP